MFLPCHTTEKQKLFRKNSKFLKPLSTFPNELRNRGDYPLRVHSHQEVTGHDRGSCSECPNPLQLIPLHGPNNFIQCQLLSYGPLQHSPSHDPSSCVQYCTTISFDQASHGSITKTDTQSSQAFYVFELVGYGLDDFAMGSVTSTTRSCITSPQAGSPQTPPPMALSLKSTKNLPNTDADTKNENDHTLMSSSPLIQPQVHGVLREPATRLPISRCTLEPVQIPANRHQHSLSAPSQHLIVSLDRNLEKKAGRRLQKIRRYSKLDSH